MKPKCDCKIYEVYKICTPKEEYERISKLRDDILNKAQTSTKGKRQ